MTENRINVLICDDQAIVRKGIRALLATEPNIEVIGEAENGQEAISQTEELRPDVILMDLVMPEVDGIEAIRCITARQPETRILVLTSFATDDKVFPAIKAGALGYLLKTPARKSWCKPSSTLIGASRRFIRPLPAECCKSFRSLRRQRNHPRPIR